jgi:micrococcal nuclease
MNVKKQLILISITLALIFLSACSLGIPMQSDTGDSQAFMEVEEQNLEKAKVSRVVDGDTFEIIVNNKKQKVRLILVDTPETSAPGRPKGYFGTEAKDYTTSRLTNQTVWLEKDVQAKDQYGRLLRYVYLDVQDGKGEFFNGTLVRSGFARMATYPPNVKYVEQIRLWQKEAREAGRGIWQDIEQAFPDRKPEK